MHVAGGAMGRRLFRRALWRSRREAAWLIGSALGWVLLGWGARAAMSAAGVGAEWGAAKTAVTCAGSVVELLLAGFIPMCACIDDIDHPGSYTMMGDDHYRGPSEPDPVAVRVGIFLGLCVLGLDAGRLLSPVLSAWAPAWLCGAASAWWLFVDGVCAAGMAAVMLGCSGFGLLDLWRASVRVDPAGWCAAEREEIGLGLRAGRPGRSKPRL